MIIFLRTLALWAALSSLTFFSALNVFAQNEPFDVPLAQLTRKNPENVVRFTVTQATETQATVKLETRGGFKIYDKGLRFWVTKLGASTNTDLLFSSEAAPAIVDDPFYNEKRAVHFSNALFKVTNSEKTKLNGPFFVKFEACSVDSCLLPTVFQLEFLDGARGVRVKETNLNSSVDSLIGESAPNSASQVSKVSKEVDSFGDFTPPVAKVTSPQASVISADSVSNRATLWVQNSLVQRSWWLFPALLLAGLLMNLTPCVYPMIPITLNVLSSFGTKKTLGKNGDEEIDHWSRNRKLFPFVYVAGMVLSYTLMGVAAGMTGTLFGSLLQSVYVTTGIAIVMVLLGLSMLGVLDLSRIQTFATRIPIAHKYPMAGLLTMGAVSGLVSAPCTGPVLSMILLLIGQSKDPIYGLVLMLFFSFGFGAPYIFLGLFTQKLGKLPKVGNILNAVKILFAALMFALALYYLKPSISSVALLQFLFVMPSVSTVLIVSLIIVICELLSRLQPSYAKGSRFVELVAATCLALWFTLFLTSGFVRASEPSVTSESSYSSASEIAWVKKWEIAKVRAATEQKFVLVDLWAEWCAACLKMDATVWNDPRVVKIVNQHFIPVKLDFTRTSDFSEKIIDLWEISGLPAVAFFKVGDSLDKAPDTLFREAVTVETFLKTANELIGK